MGIERQKDNKENRVQKRSGYKLSSIVSKQTLVKCFTTVSLTRTHLSLGQTITTRFFV